MITTLVTTYSLLMENTWRHEHRQASFVSEDDIIEFNESLKKLRHSKRQASYVSEGDITELNESLKVCMLISW